MARTSARSAGRERGTDGAVPTNAARPGSHCIRIGTTCNAAAECWRGVTNRLNAAEVKRPIPLSVQLAAFHTEARSGGTAHRRAVPQYARE
jgi:hypothetical protein